jgi:carbamoyltransferase
MITLGYTGFTRNSRRSKGRRSPFAKTNLTFDTIFVFRDGEVPFTCFPLGFLGHDASAAIIRDGKIIACAAEERFLRVKHSLNLAGNTLLPRNAIKFCLREANISIDEVDIVAHYCDFRQSLIERRRQLLQPFLSPEWDDTVKNAYQQVYDTMMHQPVVQHQFKEMTGRLMKHFFPVRHHEAHAASAFYPSGFEEALILTLDGTGEVESSLLAVGRGNTIEVLRRVYLPTSLGTLYLLITAFLGFRTLGDEYKVMGLAAYGNPRRFQDFFHSLVLLETNGCYSTPALAGQGLREVLLKALGPSRKPGEEIAQRHADVAAALQAAVEGAVLHTLRHARAETGLSRLCLAGGVALNCQLNGAISRSGLFRDIFVQPASSDEGCSAGAALYAHYRESRQYPNGDTAWQHVYLGPAYGNDDIHSALKEYADRVCWQETDNIIERAAAALAGGKVLGWFQGRMEFGPRALGNRSILADSRDPQMKDRINAKVKHREGFRPFAPAVLEETAGDYFDLQGLTAVPYMLFALPVRESQRKQIPAVTHNDGTARVQTVSRDTNPRFWELIRAFGHLTGMPVLLNTSFNDRNEPIVCTPVDALRCFLSTGIDYLAIGDFWVEKEERDA